MVSHVTASVTFHWENMELADKMSVFKVLFQQIAWIPPAAKKVEMQETGIGPLLFGYNA